MKILFFILFFGSLNAFSQSTEELKELAQHYFVSEQYDKAESYYEKLYKRSKEKFIYNRLKECYIQQKDFTKAEKLIKKKISTERNPINAKMELGEFYETYDDSQKAEKIYTDLIDELIPNKSRIIDVYSVFKQKNKLNLAYQALTKGRKILKQKNELNFQFANYYALKLEYPQMLHEYFDLIDSQPAYRRTVQSILSKQMNFEDESENALHEILKEELLSKIQKHPNDETYPIMLTWLFMQKKNFSAAFIQIKAIDKRTNARGAKVYELGNIARENKDFSAAKKCFQYVVELGEDSPAFIKAKRSLLNAQFLQVTQERSFNKQEIQETVANYQTTLNEIGLSNRTISMLLELAHIQAYYNNTISEAKKNLEKGLSTAGITDMQKAEIKMSLADIYVLEGDIWEAALLYGQVDKTFKYETIGHEAKFKNARIFYYDGEFNYAQSQLDVLKESTSKLIANDALQLSLLITDNFGLDSNYQAMNWFANADLLIEQHRYEEAFALFDSITKNYPAHSLGDEILFKKAQAQQLQGKWSDATSTLKELLEFYSDDILADDALFQLGDIYQNKLMNPEESKQYYKTILFDYKGSFYSEEARKRYRKLREQFPENKIEK